MSEPQDSTIPVPDQIRFYEVAEADLVAYEAQFTEIIEQGGPMADMFRGIKAVNDEKVAEIREILARLRGESE